MTAQTKDTKKLLLKCAVKQDCALSKIARSVVQVAKLTVVIATAVTPQQNERLI